MDRVELEFAAIDSARAMMRYLDYSPKHDTWKRHCSAFADKLHDALRRLEEQSHRGRIPDYSR